MSDTPHTSIEPGRRVRVELTQVEAERLLKSARTVSPSPDFNPPEALETHASAVRKLAAALAEQDLPALSLGRDSERLKSIAYGFETGFYNSQDKRTIERREADADFLRDLAKNLGDGGQGEGRAALEQISAIRESIVAHQNINWSAHIYPLVAVLGQAGIDTSDIDFEDMKAAYLADSNTHRGVGAYTKLGIVLEERGLRPENNPLLRANCECAHKRASHRNVVGDTRCEVDGCGCTQMRVRASS